jgi:hypothetical protein
VPSDPADPLIHQRDASAIRRQTQPVTAQAHALN